MLRKPTSIAAMENILMKLTMKQKQFIYQIAKLEYRIYNALLKLENVNALIEEEEKNINSLIAAIQAAGEGKVAEKLLTWKIKAEYKLFKLNLRKNKIDIIKLAFNQSKLEQARQALISIEKDINDLQQSNKAGIMENEEIKDLKTGGILWDKTKHIEKESLNNKKSLLILKKDIKLAS